MNSAGTEYTDAINGLEQFGTLLCGLIKELLLDSNIQVHNITYRVKDPESASRKLSLKGEKYGGIAELTDLLGVRIITYFPNDVDRVAQVIEKEFSIDRDNSVDKRKLLDPDKFGYLSLHYVAMLTSHRCKLTEYKRFAVMRFELQVRSILQHAWAEIEHDLGYKAEGDLPLEMRRSFSRLASLLELADEEFERLRDQISKYEQHVDRTIKSKPEALPLNQSTIVTAFEQESALNRLDQEIAIITNRPLKKNIEAGYVASEAGALRILGIQDIGELLLYADQYKDHISLFVERWAKKDRSTPLYRGIGLFYLGYALAAQLPDSELKGWGLHILGEKEDLLKRVRSTWQEVVDEKGQPPKIKGSELSARLTGAHLGK